MTEHTHPLKRVVIPVVKRFTPGPVWGWARRVRHGFADLGEHRTPWAWRLYGSLRRSEPIRRNFGHRSGQTVARYYIEGFLSKHERDIHGRVLEIGDRGYTLRFGGDRVTRSDVLHAVEGNPTATLVGDLSGPLAIPNGSFDAVILTQTLGHIYDVRSAVRTVFRILKPRGVVLASLSSIRQISRYDMDRWGDYWRFTSLSARRLFEEAFPAEAVTVQAHGNVLAAVGYLHGINAGEFHSSELIHHDPGYEVLITVRAEKPLF